MPGRPHLISHGQLRDEPAVYSTAGNRVSSGGTCSCSPESQQTCIGRPVSWANRPPTSHVISPNCGRRFRRVRRRARPRPCSRHVKVSQSRSAHDGLRRGDGHGTISHGSERAPSLSGLNIGVETRCRRWRSTSWLLSGEQQAIIQEWGIR